MGIRIIYFIAAVVMLVLLLGLVSSVSSQEPVEAAFVRGHFSEGDGVWRADDFGWFYYDLDKDQDGEELRIDLDGRTAEEGHIVYSSKTWSRQFEYEPWGSFEAVAFLGKPYFAGYPESNFTEEVSSLGKGELRYLFIDEDRTQTLSSNSTLALQQGYVLVAAEVSEKNGVVNFFLLKNGKPVYASVVSIGDTFVYKVNDVPVILVHLANAMRSDDEGLAEIDGIFQISDTPSIKLFDGGRLGNMKLTDHSEEGIEFQNNNSLTFSKDSVVPLTPDLQIIVLDLPTPVYYPVGGIFDYGMHEIRGPVFNANPSIPVLLGKYNSTAIARWNSLNYSGFYFDSEDILGNENLVLHSVQGRTILATSKARLDEPNNTAVQNGLQYTSIIQVKDFEYKPWGHYFVISFPGTSQPWFAGYDSVLEGGKSSKSLLEHEYLGFVLLDLELGSRILAGNYSLDEGYEMRIRDVDDDSIFIQLLKNGITVDSSVVKSNSTYVYKKDFNDIDDMPIIMAHFSSVFDDGNKERFATIDGIFQISDQFLLPIEPGRGMGELEIVATLPNQIIMVNPDRITLNSNSNVNIGPGMDIHVADNDTLRYYLYTSKYVVPAPEPPLINAQDNVSSSASANVSIIVKAAEIRQVMVSILNSSNRTVFSRDITRLGQGSGDLWSFAWKWNASTMQLSDDKSLILDSSGSPVPGLLYLNSSASPRQVGVTFDSEGKIGAILDSASIYYVSRGEYKRLNNSLDYDAMLANGTARDQFIKIEPGKSVLQFIDLINGKWNTSGINHTLQGNLEALEPHVVVGGAKPGRYELRVRVENAVNAIQAFGEFFNVTPAEMRGVSLGVAQAFAGGEVSIPLQAPNTGGEKRINISYDAAKLGANEITGECNASWQVDAKLGRIGILLPGGCGAANLTFAVSRKSQVNDTIDLEVIGTSGFKPETISNGTITIVAGDKGAEKSHALGFLATLIALATGAYTRRRV